LRAAIGKERNIAGLWQVVGNARRTRGEFESTDAMVQAEHRGEWRTKHERM
jgi:hypothetical protein